MADSPLSRRIADALVQRVEAEERALRDWEDSIKPTTISSTGIVQELGMDPRTAQQQLSNTTAGAGVPIAGVGVPGGLVGDWVPRIRKEEPVGGTVLKILPCFVLAVEESSTTRRRASNYARRFWLWDGADALQEITIDSKFLETFTVVEYRRSGYDAATGISTREVNILDTLAPGDSKSFTTTDARGGYSREYNFTYSSDGWIDVAITDPDPSIPNTEINDQAYGFTCDAYLTLQYQCTEEADFLLNVTPVPFGNDQLFAAFMAAPNQDPDVLDDDGWFIDVWDYAANYYIYEVSTGATAGSTEIELKEYLSGIYSSPSRKIPIGSSFYLRYSNGTLAGETTERFTVLSRSGDIYTVTPALSKDLETEYYPGRLNSMWAGGEDTPFFDTTRTLDTGFTLALDPAYSIQGAFGKTVGIGTFQPSFLMGQGTRRNWRVEMNWYPPLTVSQGRMGPRSMTQCSRIGSKLSGVLMTPENAEIFDGRVQNSYLPADDIPVLSCKNGVYWKFEPFQDPDYPTLAESEAVNNALLQFKGNVFVSPSGLTSPRSRPGIVTDDPSQPAFLQSLLSEKSRIDFRLTNLPITAPNTRLSVDIGPLPWDRITDDPAKVQVTFASAVIRKVTRKSR